MRREKKQKKWPGGFSAGDRVTCNGRYARVVSALKKDVELGMVPIIYADRETRRDAWFQVPADHLYRGWEDKVWKWGPFIAGDLAVHQGNSLVQVVMAFRRDVPKGYVPVIFSDPDHAMVSDQAVTKNTENVCMDDLASAKK